MSLVSLEELADAVALQLRVVVVVEVVEEVKAEDVIVEVEPTTEIIEEKSAVEIKETAVISFDDLKEFHNLLKDLNK